MSNYISFLIVLCHLEVTERLLAGVQEVYLRKKHLQITVSA
jgi:hypothetical protein